MSDVINNVKTTFSSWDSCMSKAYCKWPVIAGIIIGSLILLSVIICISRCICCGADCVCCCFKCCSGCCGSGRKNKGHQQLSAQPPVPYGASPHGGGFGGGGLPFHNQQYQSAPQPVYHHQNNVASGNPYGQTATFEGKVHEDSVPAMPRWATAQERRVEVIEATKPNEAHELEKLSPTGQVAGSPLAGFAAPTQPVRAMNSSAPPSPYGGERDPFLQGQQTSGVMGAHEGYRGMSTAPQHSAQAIGHGFAAHRPGGLEHAQPSYNSSYQDSQTGSYAQGGYGEAPRRPRVGDRIYTEETVPVYDQYDQQSRHNDAHGQQDLYSQQSRQNDGLGQQDPYSQQSRQNDGLGQQDPHAQQSQHAGGYGHQDQSQYSGTTAYDPRQDGRQEMPDHRAFSPAYGNTVPRKPTNGSWRDV